MNFSKSLSKAEYPALTWLVLAAKALREPVGHVLFEMAGSVL
jgi:hypothetical protein